MAFVPSVACFVAIPQGPQFDAVRHAVSEALNQLKVDVQELGYVSPNYVSPNLLPATSDLMEQADFVIADITSQSNDIFYELGVANALRKPTLLMAQQQVPLQGDLARYQLLLYRPGEEPKLTEYLRSWVGDVIERQRQRNVIAR